ncbi:unnamed protein product [Macrosiphum euphorbiae]|uniref:Uncharacterized protein n=1 Tax=Macrosiphum euphorbiae TaxID=13131 RepID=A0AAV0VP12_9HEMI|nr:unnamed protein product [Macrosiphum euphorbiae]
MWLNLNPQKQGPSFPFTLVSRNKAAASSQTQSVADESSLSPPNGRKIGPNSSRSRPRMSSRPGTNTAIYRKAKASDSAKHIQSTLLKLPNTRTLTPAWHNVTTISKHLTTLVSGLKSRKPGPRWWELNPESLTAQRGQLTDTGL